MTSKQFRVIKAHTGGLAVTNIPQPGCPVLFESHSHDAAFEWMQQEQIKIDRRRIRWQAVGYGFVFGAVLFGTALAVGA